MANTAEVINFPVPDVAHKEPRVADLDDGFTRIANEILEAVMHAGLSQHQLLVFMAVMRKTYGFNKKSDWVSNEQLSELTGILPHKCSAAKSALVKRGILTQTGRVIGINKTVSEWSSLPVKGTEKKPYLKKVNLPESGKKSLPESGNGYYPNQVNTKDTITKDSKDNSNKPPKPPRAVSFDASSVQLPGAPAETDAELRIRQGQSVAIPSITPFEGVDGAIANIAGVTRHKLYENDTGKTDGNGLPPHSISAIVDGGDVTEIARTIRGNKGQGVRTWGKTSVTVPDKYGNPHIISFSRPTDVPVYGKITLKVFAGYTSQIGVQIQQAVADYINRLMIGDQVLLSRIYSPANLGVVSGGNARYYDIQELLLGKSPEAVAAANINIAYDESASCKPENIIITVAA